MLEQYYLDMFDIPSNVSKVKQKWDKNTKVYNVWNNRVPYPFNILALIRNVNGNTLLNSMFVWDETPEKHDWWSRVNSENYPALPQCSIDALRKYGYTLPHSSFKNEK